MLKLENREDGNYMSPRQNKARMDSIKSIKSQDTLKTEVDVNLDENDEKHAPLIAVDSGSGSDHSSDDEVGASINKKPTIKEKFDDFNQ